MAHLYATILTYSAPFSNYRGESEGNRTPLQTLTTNGIRYAIVSGEALRYATRATLTALGHSCNRSRPHQDGPPTVEYAEFPNRMKYIDDMVFGFMVADSRKVPKDSGLQSKGDSALHMSYALALEPYTGETTFHQSPKHQYNNNAGIIYREVSYTSFQYPFALRAEDFGERKQWLKDVVRAIAQINNVGGGHARTYYEMAPRSVVARITRELASGFAQYGFSRDGSFMELNRLNSASRDLPGNEFILGGEVVRALSDDVRRSLLESGVTLEANPGRALVLAAERAGQE